jgi:hypothetical protein
MSQISQVDGRHTMELLIEQMQLRVDASLRMSGREL